MPAPVAPTPEGAFEVRGLIKTYGSALGPPLLHVPRLRLEPGQRYAMTGRNGAGKSTLLRIVAGLEGAQAGELAWRGGTVDVRRLPAAYPRAWRRELVYVHQHPYLFDASVHDNIAYGLRAHGLWDAQGRARVEALIDWGGLRDLRDAPAPKLSGGEKQRVALARALAIEPAMLLLDEPTSNLDGQARERILELIDDLAAQQRTLVVVTHDRDLLGSRSFWRLKLADGDVEVRGIEAAGHATG